MKDKSLTSWALLCSKLCLAFLTRHLCLRRIWWIMKTASFTVQGTKAIFHQRHRALAAARGKWREKLWWLFCRQVISAGEKEKKPHETEQQNNTANIVWEQVSQGGHWVPVHRVFLKQGNTDGSVYGWGLVAGMSQHSWGELNPCSEILLEAVLRQLPGDWVPAGLDWEKLSIPCWHPWLELSLGPTHTFNHCFYNPTLNPDPIFPTSWCHLFPSCYARSGIGAALTTRGTLEGWSTS